MRSAVFMSIKEIHMNRILSKIKKYQKLLEYIDKVGTTKLY